MQDTFARATRRRTRPKAGRPSAARDDRVSCSCIQAGFEIQNGLKVMFHIMFKFL